MLLILLLKKNRNPLECSTILILTPNLTQILIHNRNPNHTTNPYPHPKSNPNKNGIGFSKREPKKTRFHMSHVSLFMHAYVHQYM